MGLVNIEGKCLVRQISINFDTNRALQPQIIRDLLYNPITVPFYTPPLKKVQGIMLYPPKKIAFECPSVRLSVCPSVCLSVRQRFVSGLYLEHSLTDFLQTLYRSSYQEGVVWD